ncbi:amino acid ABC transporter substrate-binding protein [bacterium]|nr:amino acid ABC transporter substrate-binding protein [bacterium]
MIIFFLLFLCASTSKSYADTGALKIGIIASLSGPAGEQGKNWLAGAELAVDDLKQKGINLELVVEDDATETKRVATAFTKLATQDKVSAIVGGTWDYLAEVAYPLALKHQIPFLTPTNAVEFLSEETKKNPFVFTNALTLAAEKEVLRDFILATKPQAYALIYAQHPFAVAHAELVKSLAEQYKLALSFSAEILLESYSDTLKTAALKVKQYNPELVYIIADYQGLDLFTRELARLKSNPRILTVQHLDQAFDLARDPSRFRNSFAAYPDYDQAFDQKFIAKFNAKPRVFAAHGYDAVMFLALALSAGIKLEDSSATFSYQGVTGEHLLPTRKRALVTNRAVLMTTQAGRFEKFSSLNLATKKMPDREH